MRHDTLWTCGATGSCLPKHETGWVCSCSDHSSITTPVQYRTCACTKMALVPSKGAETPPCVWLCEPGPVEGLSEQPLEARESSYPCAFKWH